MHFVTAVVHSLRQFGTTVVPPPPVLKALPKIFAHSDKTVRAEGTQLAHVLYQYIGPAIETFLADLKPVQVKELKEAFEVLEKEGKGRGSVKPEKLTRQGAREAEAAAEAGEDADAGAAPEEGMSFTREPTVPNATCVCSQKHPQIPECMRKRSISFPSFHRICKGPSSPRSGKRGRRPWMNS